VGIVYYDIVFKGYDKIYAYGIATIKVFKPKNTRELTSFLVKLQSAYQLDMIVKNIYNTFKCKHETDDGRRINDLLQEGYIIKDKGLGVNIDNDGNYISFFVDIKPNIVSWYVYDLPANINAVYSIVDNSKNPLQSNIDILNILLSNVELAFYPTKLSYSINDKEKFIDVRIKFGLLMISQMEKNKVNKNNSVLHTMAPDKNRILTFLIDNNIVVMNKSTYDDSLETNIKKIADSVL